MGYKVSWYYLEYQSLSTYGHDIQEWLDKHVGKNEIDYKWDDSAGRYFVCFKYKEDATAFSLKWEIK